MSKYIVYRGERFRQASSLRKLELRIRAGQIKVTSFHVMCPDERHRCLEIHTDGLRSPKVIRLHVGLEVMSHQFLYGMLNVPERCASGVRLISWFLSGDETVSDRGRRAQ